MATMQTSLGMVSYTDVGSGPPVVLLHAALHDRTDFAPVTEALATGRRVLALDWPGHGESPLPATPLPAVNSVICSSSSPTDSILATPSSSVTRSVATPAAGWRWSDPNGSRASC